jgi:hypothetical protein
VTVPECAHEACRCPVLSEDEPHCSPYCANADVDRDELPPGACACEHDACTDSQRTARAGTDVKKAYGDR